LEAGVVVIHSSNCCFSAAFERERERVRERERERERERQTERQKLGLGTDKKPFQG
jgi:hypothetical protein